MPPETSTPNALIHENSPYLLQHAHNPVPWMPWSDAAFEEARRRDVPIFLSVGYATCYWCHVMERESFEDAAVGRAMAERFVCVKVDREERPDIDEAYMAATQIMTGSGGWPMSVFLEPKEGRPFWAGTYFPPQPMHGRPSFLEVLEGVSSAWNDQRDEVMEQAERLAQAVGDGLGVTTGERIDVGPQAIAEALRTLLTMVDRTNGGFGGAPKFPQPVYLDLLLTARNAADEATRQASDTALRQALDRMMVGGIYDHVGGGFHRYAVDATWTVPHFEKMLYDNGQLLATYARAARIFEDDGYAHVARGIVSWAEREMVLEGDGYASALDAEVDGREGLNYLWTVDEVRSILDETDADLAADLYGLDRGPNFRDPHHPDEPMSSVLRLDDRLEKYAADHELDLVNLRARLEAVNAKLLAVRDERKAPIQDDKALAAWNAMMLQGLASAAVDLHDHDMLAIAERVAAFLTDHMLDHDGLPRRSWRDGKSVISGFLEDAAWCICGLAELARARIVLEKGDPREAIDRALAMLHATSKAFGDPNRTGVLYDTRQQELFVRGRSTYDGATPSAHSVLLNAMATLHEFAPDAGVLDHARTVLQAIAPAIADSPVATAGATAALLRFMQLDPAFAEEVVEAELERVRALPAPVDDDFTPVEIYASGDRVMLGPDLPAQLSLVVRVKTGWHVYAADPGQPDLSPLRVGIRGGTGVRVYADYPKGAAWSQDESIRVYEDTLEFPIALELEGEWAGRPMLAVSYQACDDQRCLAVRTVELDVAIDRVGEGELGVE
ncbi:MAG: thioredoxin domain-containing protein [Phycisphaerales bacterium]|nr:thioredoxin domain-containing protein [Phycisphaerales bacterium]